MSTHKSIDRICVIVIALCLTLTVLFMNGQALGIEVIRDEDAESYTGTEWFTANDQNGDWDDSSATVIKLQGDTAKVSGGGAYAYDGGVMITGGGWYVLSGTLTDGSITVDAEAASKVWIRLDGVEISCSDDACLRIDQADKVFLTLGAGTENSFSSGSAYSESALADGTGGAIFSHDDLTINGSGSLKVTAQYKHGIDVNDTLVIAGGTITIDAPADGLHVNDGFRLMSAALTISCGDDAIHCDNAVCIASGAVMIESCYEGIEALTIDITGGDITIYPTDDGLNANGSSGFDGFRQGQATKTETAEEEETYIRISGGTLTIINENARDADGMDSNGSIYIDGGRIRISLSGSGSNNAIDYGSESGGVCIVTGGDIIACGGSGMTEAFSTQSTQCAVLYNPGITASAGTSFRVLDADGNEILAYSPPCSYSSVAFSVPALSVGETYMVCIGDETSQLVPESTAAMIGSSSFVGTGGFGGFSRGERPTEGSEQDPASGAGSGSFPYENGGASGTFGGPFGGRDGGDRPMRPGSGESSGESSDTEGGFPSRGEKGQWGDAGSLPEWDSGSLPGNGPAEDGSEEAQEGGWNSPEGFNADREQSETASASSSGGATDGGARLLLAASAAVLLIGLIAAVFYRRRGQ